MVMPKFDQSLISVFTNSALDVCWPIFSQSVLDGLALV